jgi:hypothetical protein
MFTNVTKKIVKALENEIGYFKKFQLYDISYLITPVRII